MLINLKKCYFIQDKSVYLEFVILVDGLNMDPKKVKEIVEWPTLENVGEVRYFHGLASFYRMFTRNFSFVCNAMTGTIRVDKKAFKWTHGADKSFETLKQKVCELPLLDVPFLNKVFQVIYDASGSKQELC